MKLFVIDHKNCKVNTFHSQLATALSWIECLFGSSIYFMVDNWGEIKGIFNKIENLRQIIKVKFMVALSILWFVSHWEVSPFFKGYFAKEKEKEGSGRNVGDTIIRQKLLLIEVYPHNTMFFLDLFPSNARMVN